MGCSLPSFRTRIAGLLNFLLALLMPAGEALALRPFLSATDADLVGQGIIELETGASFQRRVGGEQGRFSLGATNFAFNTGVSERVQLTVTAGPDLFFSDAPVRVQHALNTFAEAAFTTKVRLAEASGIRPALATEWTVALPAEAGVGSQSLAAVAILAASANLGPVTSHLNLGGAVEPRQGESKGAAGSLLWAASGQFPLHDRFDVVGEVRGRISQGALPNHTALMGLVWKLRGGVRVDLAAFMGLSRGADDWGIVGGLTYELSAFPWGVRGVF